MEAFASNVLQRNPDHKSDDVNGRLKAYETIAKENQFQNKVCQNRFAFLSKNCNLGLDMRVLDEDDNEVELRDLDEGE